MNLFEGWLGESLLQDENQKKLLMHLVLLEHFKFSSYKALKQIFFAFPLQSLKVRVNPVIRTKTRNVQVLQNISKAD